MDNPLQGLKLIQDFGVRALLSTIVITGYIGIMVLAILAKDEQMITSITTLYTPLVFAVVMFYFHSSDARDLRS